MDEKNSGCCWMRHKAGLLVILFVAIIIAVYMGTRSDYFSAKTSVFILTDNGLGINECQPVVFHGFRIGKVGRITLTDDGRVKAELLIKNEYLKWVRTDSTAQLLKDGGGVIDISGGTPGKPVISRAGTIEFHLIPEIVTGLGGTCESGVSATDAGPAMADIKSDLMYVNDPDGEFRQSVDKLNRLFEGMTETRRDMQRVLAHTDGALMEAQPALRKLNDDIIPDAQTTLGAVSHAAARTETLMKNLNNNIPAILNSISECSSVSAREEPYGRGRHDHKVKKQSIIEVDSYE